MAKINYARYDTETSMYFNCTLDLPSTNRAYYLMFVDDYTSVGHPSDKYWCVGKTYVAPASSSTWSFSVSTSIYDERNCYLREVSSSTYSNYSVGGIYSSLTGTGPQKPVAMIVKTYKWRLAYRSNGGTWVGEGTSIIYQPDDEDWYEEDSAATHRVYPTTPTGYTLKPPTGKSLLGWATTSAGEPVSYVDVTSTTSGTQQTFYAIFGIAYSHSIRYLNDASVFYTDEWSDGNEYITARPVYSGTPTRSGYTFRYWQSSTGNHYVYGQTITEDLASVDLTAVFTEALSKFYWHGSDASDNSYFQTGNRISTAITASAWNNLQDKVYTLFVSCGAEGTYSKQTAQPSGTIYALQYNNTVDGLQSIKNKLGGTTRIPSKVTSNTTVIIPSQWNGESTSWLSPRASLKSALNHLIDAWG